ncbi:MAG TPA: ATP-binding protein, partial [Gemmata sp.]
SPAREMIGETVRAAGRAADLTRQLLAFGRKQIVAPEPIDLNAALGEMHRMLARLVGGSVALSFLPGENPGVVQLDPGQLDQLVMNLVLNARDATPHDGRIVVATSAVPSPPAGAPPAEWGYVRLVVSDTGAGMSDEVRRQMFEPFFTTKSIGKGVGLGLATVYAIVTQAGGWIDVASEVGKGTRVSVFLPRRAGPPSPPNKVAGALTGRETILLAEDEEDVRRVVVTVLRGAGYTVLEALDGYSAMSLAGQYPGTIDLLLTDVAMPGVGGRELAEWVKVQRPSIRLFYMSGHTEDETVLGLVQAREAAFLQKPFLPAALLSKVRDVLSSA